MATSVLACLFFIFFLPCFSNSCTDKLPCNPSIQIKPPFYLQSDLTKDPNCQGNLTIGCDNNKQPFLSLLFKLLLLESISYVNNTITVQVPYFSSSLNKSGCGNLYFNFSTDPVNDFHYEMQEQLKTSLYSVRCDPLNQIQSPPKIFGTDYNLSYSPSLDEDHKTPPNCWRTPNKSFAPSFEYIFLFHNGRPWLSLLSASYSSDLVAQPDCFANSTEVLNRKGGNFANSTEVSDREHEKVQTSSPFVDLQIFSEEYTLNYSATTGEHLPSNCSRKIPNASFERKFQFDDDGILILLSAKYSYNILSQQGCFSQSIVGGNIGKMVRAKRQDVLIICTAVGSLAFIVVSLILILKLRSSKNCAECILWSKDKPQGNIKMLLENNGSLAPKTYKYAEVKKFTCSFQDTLGKGGFGTVYRGKLQDGRLAAVKILHNSLNDREELSNEILSIARTSHVNVVSLLGFCIEGSKHALIYEYMPNGSLDNYIYSENPKAVLGWEKLYEIAIGIARGLEYLHRGCNAHIVHFDIKPQNILLDEDFNPKIADFGLAKLCPPKESILSMAEMRGTIGYIAPEVFSRSFGVVSMKSDVYSYGMMVLEMVGGRRNAKSSVENPSQVYFPHWLYDRLVEGSSLQACDVSIETEEIAKKMGMVGLWCTQMSPGNRPSMNIVVRMLEKSLDELEMPPKSYLCSPPHSKILSDSSHTLKFGLNLESDSDCLLGGANTL